MRINYETLFDFLQENNLPSLRSLHISTTFRHTVNENELCNFIELANNKFHMNVNLTTFIKS